jgi:arginase
MAAAAMLPLPYPESAVVEAATLAEQTLELASALPARPVVLGGCCCAHVGAVEGLASRWERLGVVWIDAHGDLNTPASSPSGNAWGMPFRMLLDDGTVGAERAALVGARNLDPPEEAFIAEVGLPQGEEGVERVLAVSEAVYVALDCDVLDPGAGVSVFMPEPDGPALEEVESVLARIAAAGPLAGVGVTGLLPEDRNAAPLARLCRAAGL